MMCYQCVKEKGGKINPGAHTVIKEDCPVCQKRKYCFQQHNYTLPEVEQRSSTTIPPLAGGHRGEENQTRKDTK